MLAPGGEFRDDSEWTQRAIAALAGYGAFVEELTAATGLTIDYRVTGAMELAFNDAEREELIRPRPEGIPVEEVTVASSRYFAPIPTQGVLAVRWFPNEAVVDPRHVCAALAAACRELGVEIREDDPLRECTGPTVAASGAWATQLTGVPPEPRAFPVKGHLLGYHCKEESMPPIVRHGHHYALQRANGFTVFGSDEQPEVWDTTPDAERVRTLSVAAAALLPRLLDRPPDEFWAGLRPASTAGAPVVGQVPGRPLWLAYGHFRNGILLADVTAKMITESVLAHARSASSETD